MNLSRREILGSTAAFMGAAMSAGISPGADASQTPQRTGKRPANEPFGYCLNTSTIRGNNLDIAAQIDVTAKAGYDAIEPWARDIEAYTAHGGTPKDLAKRIGDSGLTVEDVIAFNSWLDDDDARRAKSMENLKREMDIVAQIGGKRIATPPGNNGENVSLDHAIEYYRAALELGEQMGVQPSCELWGRSAVLGPLSHGAYVAIGTGRADASMLLDIFHLYKSGTSFASLNQVNGAALHVLHVNDYPAADDPAKLTDANRVYPGDGVAPLGQIFRDLRDNGFRGVLSLELFNQEYWKMSAEENARTGLQKTRAAVRKALA
ncbi:MAG TPA: sugar phosphate isomerase/epimerase family protein [Candidatus Binatia bacterium]|nr:sugar phosphate isomerase/epimerase family protein [Candidatus Binatia bacterium]